MDQAKYTVLGTILLVLSMPALIGGLLLGLPVAADEVSLSEPSIESQHMALAMATYGSALFVTGVVLACTGILVLVMASSENRRRNRDPQDIQEGA